MNGLLGFLLPLGEVLLREAAKEASPVLLRVARELGRALVDAIDVKRDPRLLDEERAELLRDAMGTTKEAWRVIVQEGLLLAGDIAMLTAKAAAAGVAGELGINV